MATITAISTRFATEMVKMFQFRYEPGWFRSMAAEACPARATVLNGAWVWLFWSEGQAASPRLSW